jgi:hypothetical protein
MPTTKSVAAQGRFALNQASFSVEDALTLLDLQERACFVERLFYAWPNDEKWRVTRIPRPTSQNTFNAPVRLVDKTADDPIIWCRNDDDDARFLMEQLQRPQDHVAELHRRVQRVFSGRIGHLKPSDQRLMKMQSVLWSGANESSGQDIVSAVVRFQLCELSAAELRPVVKTAGRIVRVAQEHVAVVERVRMAIANDEPLPNLARPVERLRDDPPSWFEFEAPGPDNAPW